MNIFKQQAKNKANKLAKQIEDLCNENEVRLFIDGGRIELLASVEDEDGKHWWSRERLDVQV